MIVQDLLNMTKANLAVLVFVFILLMPISMNQEQIGKNAPSGADEWPMFQHDTAHTGYSTEILNANLTVAWTYRPNSSYNGFAYRTPVVANGNLYITDDNYLYCINSSSGNLKWNQSLTVQGPSAQWGFSTAVSQGIVYTDDAAYNASTGHLVFRYQVRGSTSPTMSNGKIYMGSNSGGIVALNATNGNTVWSKPGDKLAFSPAVAGGVVYYASGNFFYERADSYALNETTGNQIWHLTGIGGPYAHAVASGDFVYVNGYGGYIYCLDSPTGKTVWSYRVNTGPYDPYNSPVVANGYLYAASYAFSATSGIPMWNRTQLSGSSPAVAGGVVYVNYYNFSMRGMTPYMETIYAFNASTGVQIWSYPFPGQYQNYVVSSPIVAGGMIYIAAKDALYAFGHSDTTENPSSTISMPLNIFLEIVGAIAIALIIIVVAVFLLHRSAKKTP
jgi:outer membrane protein assembly factor BamB